MKQKAKIGVFESVSMIVVAAFFDGIQFIGNFINAIPLVGQILSFFINMIVTIFAFVIFTVWFFMKKVSFFNTKKPLRMFAKIGMFSSEALPFISMFPAISIAVFMTLAEANGPHNFPMSLFKKVRGPQGRVISKIVGR